LFPITAQEILGTLFIALVNSVGTSVGIGGGEFVAPYFVLILQRNLMQAINYAFIVVFGGALGTFLNIGFMRDPVRQKPVINYDLNIIVIPGLFIGVLISAIPHKILPDIAVYTVLFLVLGYSLYETRINLVKRLEKERESMKETGQPDETPKKLPELHGEDPQNNELTPSEADSFVHDAQQI
jgi:uncharacterized membrane protein YfcA